MSAESVWGSPSDSDDGLRDTQGHSGRWEHLDLEGEESSPLTADAQPMGVHHVAASFDPESHYPSEHEPHATREHESQATPNLHEFGGPPEPPEPHVTHEPRDSYMLYELIDEHQPAEHIHHQSSEHNHQQPAEQNRHQPAEHSRQIHQLTFEELVAAATEGTLVFRVHTAASVSPLVWTGEERTSGFCCANWILGSFTPTAYRAALQTEHTIEGKGAQKGRLSELSVQKGGFSDLSVDAAGVATGMNSISLRGARYQFQGSAASQARQPPTTTKTQIAKQPIRLSPWKNWTDGYVLRQGLVDHLTNRSRLTAHDAGEGQIIASDALSPWISSSRDMQWVIWEVARRLTLGEDSVQVALISMTNRAGVSGEITLDPLGALHDHRRKERGTGQRGRMTQSEKDVADRAIASAVCSSEILFYGHVFAGSIPANLFFTKRDLPLHLPAYMFRPRESYWIDGLVWAAEDDYATARRKISASRQALESNRR